MNYFKVIAVIFQTNTKNKLGMEGNVMFKNLYDFATRKEFS